jgi:hypothetical protein
MTIPSTAAPRTSASTTSRRPNAVLTVCASSAQTTPDAVPATVFWRPATPPPAARKHPRATITGHSDRGTFASSEISVHTATTPARLNPRAVIAFIACLLTV